MFNMLHYKYDLKLVGKMAFKWKSVNGGDIVGDSDWMAYYVTTM